MKLSTTPVRPTRGSAASLMWRSLFIGGVGPCLALAPLVGVTGFLLGGAHTAWSALGGLGLATGFFLMGFACLRVVLASPSTSQLAGALGVFFLQVTLLLGLVDVIDGTPGLQGRPFALGGLVAALAWQAGQAWVVIHGRRPAYGDLPMPGDEA